MLPRLVSRRTRVSLPFSISELFFLVPPHAVSSPTASVNNKVSFFIQALFGVQRYDKEMKERAGDGLFLLLSRRECLVGLLELEKSGMFHGACPRLLLLKLQ